MNPMRWGCWGLGVLCLTLVFCQGTDSEQQKPLTVLLWDSPTTINPNRDFDSVTDSVLFNVFEPLVTLDHNLQLTAGLAVSWDNPTPEVWRFFLRKGVRFHDGTPLNATIAREALLHVAQAGYETSGILSPVKEIQVVDEFTIDLVTERPSALLSKLPFIHVFKDNKGSFPPYLGTGPYRITKWEPKEAIELQSFDGYWGVRPEFERVRVIPVHDAAQRVQMLSSGQADVSYAVPVDATTHPVPGISILKHAGLTVYYLGVDMQDQPSNPFRDPRVRQAIHLAIDRKQVIKKAIRGYGSIPTQPVAPYVFGFDPEIPLPEHNIEKARQLMTEAGYPQGFSVRLDFSNFRTKVAEMIRDDLKKINIEIALNGIGRNEVYELAEAGRSSFFLLGWDCSSGDASEFYEFNLHTRSASFGQGNYGGYSNQEMDDICRKQSFIVDDRDRRELLQRAGHIAMRDLPVIPVFMEDDLYALKDSLYFEPRGDGQIRLVDVKRK